MKKPEATPVIAQYLEIKEKNQDCLVFFQMGDFYELFFEDAKIAASELDIVLTFRGKYQDEDIPMCGVPVHNYQSYSSKLVQRGYRIAVCAQTESPIEAKKRGYKAIVNRQIVRIVTTGTATEEHLLEARSDNFLCVIAAEGDYFSCFFYDISTGKIHFFYDQLVHLKEIILHKKPSEIIYQQENMTDYLKDIDIPSAYQPPNSAPLLPAFDAFAHEMNDLEKKTLHILCHYLMRTQCQIDVLIQLPQKQFYSEFLQLDVSSQQNLEIFKTLSGEKKPTLRSTLDQCKTSAGGRLLAEYLSFPITDKARLEQRYDAVGFFYENPNLGEGLLEILKKTADLNRILGRLKANRAAPADLGHMRDTLNIIQRDIPSLTFERYMPLPALVLNAYNQLCAPLSVGRILNDALRTDMLPISLKMGDFIQAGYDDLLDEFKTLKSNAQQYILELEQKYRNMTEISSLKIKHNNIIGYHIDVSSTHSETLLNKEFEEVTFIHKQTLANHVRFTTQELIGLEKKISEASLSFDQREKEIFTQICHAVNDELQPLLDISHGLAILDLYASHGVFSKENNYCRPEIVTQKTLQIHQGRHGVVEALLKKKSEKFIPNDAFFKKDQKYSSEIWLVTGPNMGGKSTFLRQTVLMIIMAQAGFFVPATQYTASIFDKIFSRVGASDNLAEGKSTFMSEMSETAHILQNATAQSFVILDELGRGTSTYDGLAIAYATLKYLSETIGALGLFATHYHEMTQMIRHHKRIGNLQASVSHHKQEIIFLHKIALGAAQHSYGIHVAELAGMPVHVIHDAQNYLQSLNKGHKSKHDDLCVSYDLPLLSAPPSPQDADPIIIEQPHPVIDMLRDADINALSPMAAFELIGTLKDNIEKNS